jgi:hypothetical protein
MNEPNKKRGGAQLWKALKQAEIDDDLAEIEAMSDTDLDAYISSNGGDPAGIRARGEALVKGLIESRERLAWHGEMDSKLTAFRATAEATRTRTPLPRAELHARLTVARNNPRFAAPAAMLFQKKTAEASTDEELQALLDELELLAKLESE